MIKGFSLNVKYLQDEHVTSDANSFPFHQYKVDLSRR
jgi:hypothetical protein